MTIRVGNAPVSFGVFEPGFGETKQLPYPTVLDQIAAAGYEGTELGPYGYLPTDAGALAGELDKRGLALASSFVPVALADPTALDAAVQEVLTVGRLLVSREVGEVIVADTVDERRAATAGCEPPGWSDKQWEQAARTLEVLADALHRELGMAIVIHHHAGTYLETPAEVERLLAVTDPERVNLLLDTGHYVYGGGDPLELLRAHPGRVTYLHYKDVDAELLSAVRRQGIHMQDAWRQGVFVPLGRGCVDFLAITKQLRERAYSGWIIVEQDTVADEQGKLSPDPADCAAQSRAYLGELGL
jgi:inosose dehydratase